jgi:CRISPR-associated protein Csd1
MAGNPEEFARGWLVFYHGPSGTFVHEQAAIRAAWERYTASTDSPRGQCLITGNTNVPIARTHPAIKGIPGAQSSGAALVSFNQDAFTSYGRSQNLNAPISERAAFAYTTALNHLARRESGQRLVIGDTLLLIWAERTTPAETALAEVLGGLAETQLTKPIGLQSLEGALDTMDAAESVARVTDRLKRIATGKWTDDPALREAEGIQFFILGLAPNAARLQVRFFQVDTLGVLLERIQRHCRDILFDEPEKAGYVPSLYRLAREILPKDDKGRTRADEGARRSTQKLHGDLIRSVLSGHGYPHSLLPVLLNRLRTDRWLTRERLGLVKACLNVERRRMAELSEIPMSIDLENSELGYLLGRLFASLESIQEVSRGPGGRDQRTIADRFLGAASATPRSIFPHLLDLERAHERKAKRDKPGLAHKLAKRVGELMARLDPDLGFPPQLDPQQQGLFYIGYYQERQARFAGRSTDAEANGPDNDEIRDEE